MYRTLPLAGTPTSTKYPRDPPKRLGNHRPSAMGARSMLPLDPAERVAADANRHRFCSHSIPAQNKDHPMATPRFDVNGAAHDVSSAPETRCLLSCAMSCG
jgi:hypothetical protein